MKAILQRYILPSLTGRGRGVGLLLPFLLAACSTTSHLPEGEQLYTGITEIAYGHKAGSKKGTKADSTGVITAVSKAYGTVSDLLRGNVKEQDLLQYMQQNDSLTSGQRDTLQHAAEVLTAATATAKEEVSAALSYAPNNAIFGSSKVRWGIPIGLWVYNAYADSESRFGRWMRLRLSRPALLSGQHRIPTLHGTHRQHRTTHDATVQAPHGRCLQRGEPCC